MEELTLVLSGHAQAIVEIVMNQDAMAKMPREAYEALQEYLSALNKFLDTINKIK